jgi:hypothetical protein
VVVHLTQGKRALIDASDWPIVGKLRWHAHRAHADYPNEYYARSKPGKGKGIFMHALIMGVARADHKNRNKLDNRRCNLRPSTVSQNAANWRRTHGKIEYRGVRRQRNGRFQAMIGLGGKRVGLGTYDTKEQAAKAYDEAAIREFGEFAVLNFPL